MEWAGVLVATGGVAREELRSRKKVAVSPELSALESSTLRSERWQVFGEDILS